MGLPPWEASSSQLFALITGANSGLGYAIAARMMDEFLTSPSTPPTKHLVLILCTRSPQKSRLTISRLRTHLRALVDDGSSFAELMRRRAQAQGEEYKWEDMVQRVHFLGVQADLCDLRSVYALADQLVNGTVSSPAAMGNEGERVANGSAGLSNVQVPRLDAIALNAGIGGWIGVNWPLAIRTVLWDVVDATTWPRFKLPRVGAVVKAQLASKTQKSDGGDAHGGQIDPPLGEVFCSNVFGHYLLVHELMPLLSKPAFPDSQTGGRIIWISSIEALPQSLTLDDIQGLRSQIPYESSKRLVDVLALTRNLPSIQRISAPFYESTHTLTGSVRERKSKPNSALVRPITYTAHPGVFNSDILPLQFILALAWKFIALVARWAGSPWHPADPYKAAIAPVWVSLAAPEVLEDMGGDRVKWGSSANFWGEERVMKTEVGGWGWEGKVEPVVEGERRKGRHKNAVDVTEEARAEFEALGAECWKQMEEMRSQWEDLLKPVIGKK